MASFLEMCSGTIYYPQRQDMMEKYGEKYGTEAEYTMGNGPYMMESWVHNSKSSRRTPTTGTPKTYLWKL